MTANEIADLADPDGALLRRHKVSLTTNDLLGVVRRAIGNDVAVADVAAEVRKLAEGRFAVWTKAAQRLREFGPPAVPSLRTAIAGDDPELSKRARDVHDQITDAHSPEVLPAAVRVLLRKRERVVIDPLLQLLPFIHDPELEADLWYGLDRMAATDREVGPAIGRYLTDASPSRRALAAHFTARYGGADGRKKVAGLLNDPVAGVRLRAAQGLLAAKDQAGVPTLIDLLTTDDVEVRLQAEELLRWAANDAGPASVVGLGGKPSKDVQAAWRDWWTGRGGRLDFAELHDAARRPILLLAYDRSRGKAWVLGSDGVTRHEWTGLDRLTDARWLPGGLLVAAQGTGPVNTGQSVVSLRDARGNAFWTKTDFDNPEVCQRLPNGHIFVAEHLKAGPPPTFRYQILSARGAKVGGPPAGNRLSETSAAVLWLPGGRILCYVAPSRRRDPWINDLTVFDPAVNSAVRLHLEGPTHRYRERPEVEMTQTAGYLISNLDGQGPENHEIVEFNAIGLLAWWHNLANAAYATRTRQGNTLACTPARIVEIAPDHRMVGDVPTRETASLARPCLPLVRLGFDAYPPERDLARSVEYWVRRLRSPDAFHRRYALDRLAEMDPPAAGTLADIKKLTADPDPGVRQAADRARLAAGDEDIPKLLAQAKDPDSQKSIQALIALHKYRHGKGVLDVLIAALSNDQRDVRLRAAAILGGTDSNPHQLEYEHPRSSYLWASDVILPSLIRAATDPKNASDNPDDNAQDYAIQAIGRLGKGASPVIKLLIRGMSDERPTSRYRCIEALGGFGSAPDEVVPALMKEVVRPGGMPVTAASALGEIGPPAAKAIDELIALYKGRDKSNPNKAEAVRSATFAALVKIAPTDRRVVGLFRQTLEDKHEDSKTRLDAAFHFCRLGKPTAQAALPVLEKWVPLEESHELRGRIWALITRVRYQVAEPDW